MKLQTFINKHRAKITIFILKRVPNIRIVDDKEIRLWILNDESLYLWAKQEGVKI